MWIAFIVTFLLLRLLTYGIRYHFLPFHNVVTPGGLHIHHYVWGILIVLVVGFASILNINQSPTAHAWLATFFGIGAALVIDEFALWLNLKDVYWEREGRISVDVAVFLAAVGGLYFTGSRFWNQVGKEISAGLKFMASEKARIRHRSAGN